MNKKIIILLISICLGMISIGCSNIKKTSKNDENRVADDIVKIKESVYLDYIYDIYLDKERYIGKTIEIEGMFTEEYENGNPIYYVYRLSDSIHEHDGNEHTEEVKSGLEFTYDKNIPKEDQWIKVIGILKEKKDGNIYIDADSVQIMKERGLEKVNLRSDMLD